MAKSSLGGTQIARCVNCRSDVKVEERYAQGDHIPCSVCGTSHRVVRGDVLRLVVADVGPLRESLRQNQALIESLERELRDARASFGIGANGLGVGLIYFLYQVGFNEQPIDSELGLQALLIGIGCGFVFEAANWMFLAKRKAITRLNTEMAEATEDGRVLQQKIRDSTRAFSGGR